ncbi:MAG TPA: hypothetical protein VF937_07070 [Chloroflexota bacterium]
MPGFALEPFEQRAEAYLRARAWREYQLVSGRRPGRGLVSLYDEDFPEFTSTDLWADLQAATPEDPRQLTRLSALLAAANLEGNTREFATRLTRARVTAHTRFEDHDVPWGEAAARWVELPEVPRRHALEEGWRAVIHSELTPLLERWHEALRAQLRPLGADDWLTFWSRLRGMDASGVASLAEAVLEHTADGYGHGLSVYLAQLDLPIDDVWTSDLDWAFRAPRFDVAFAEHGRMPVLIRALRDLGVELREQASLRIEYVARPGVTCLALQVPDEVHVLQRLVGGWQDLSASLCGVGMAEHLAQTDASLHVWERWLGDETPTLAYGLLLEGLIRDPTWLAARLDYVASDDFRVIANLARLRRLRRNAATALYEQRLWRAEPGASTAADYEESLSAATRSRQFTDEYLGVLLDAPWSALRSAVHLRAEVFAAQLRLYLRSEFDEEWWRSNRAARFITDELWRPGRRHSAEDLLGFMGYEGFDPSILTAEFQEVFQPL